MLQNERAYTRIKIRPSERKSTHSKGIKGLVHPKNLSLFTHPHFFPNPFQNIFPSAATLKFPFTAHIHICMSMSHEGFGLSVWFSCVSVKKINKKIIIFSE